PLFPARINHRAISPAQVRPRDHPRLRWREDAWRTLVPHRYRLVARRDRRGARHRDRRVVALAREAGGHRENGIDFRRPAADLMPPGRSTALDCVANVEQYLE